MPPETEPERIGSARIEYDDQGQKFMVTDKTTRHGSYQSRVLLTPGRRTTRDPDLLFIEWVMREELREAGDHEELARRQFAEPYDAGIEREYLNRVANHVWSLPHDLTTAATVAQAVTKVLG